MSLKSLKADIDTAQTYTQESQLTKPQAAASRQNWARDQILVLDLCATECGGRKTSECMNQYIHK